MRKFFEILLRTFIMLPVAIIVFLFTPIQPMLDIFHGKVDYQEIVDSGYVEAVKPGRTDKYAGAKAGTGYPILSSESQTDEVLEFGRNRKDDEFKTFYYVPEVVKIEPLNRYVLKAYGTGGHHYRTRGRSTDTAFEVKTKPNQKLFQSILRIQYDRYYLMTLADGSQLVCILNPDYYAEKRDITKFKFPVGVINTNVGSDEFYFDSGDFYEQENSYFLDMARDLSDLSYYFQFLLRLIFAITSAVILEIVILRILDLIFGKKENHN